MTMLRNHNIKKDNIAACSTGAVQRHMLHVTNNITRAPIQRHMLHVTNNNITRAPSRVGFNVPPNTL